MAICKEPRKGGTRLIFEHPAPVGQTTMPGWMEVRRISTGRNPSTDVWLSPQRFKAEGRDFLNPVFDEASLEGKKSSGMPAEPKVEVSMTKPDVNRKISADEVRAQDKAKPWVSVPSSSSYKFTLPHACFFSSL